MVCAPSEDSNQPEHLPSLTRVFAVRMNILWVLRYPLHTAKTLIRLGTGWIRQSSLGTQNTLFVLSCCGIYIARSSLGRTHGFGRLGLMMMLSHCKIQVTSNFDYSRAQSVLRSTDDFKFVGKSSFNSRLSHPFRSPIFLFPEMLDITGIHYTQVTFGRNCLIPESFNIPFYPGGYQKSTYGMVANRLSKFKITSIDK